MFHPEGPSLRELLHQGLSSMDQGYDLLAPKFDYTPFRTPDSVLDNVSKHLVRFGPFQNGLDVGCGTGAGVSLLLEHCQNFVVGIDRSDGMLREARRRPKKTASTVSLGWVRGDGKQIPFRNTFDLAVSFGAFGHIQEHDESIFLTSIFKSLQPKGRFIFVTSTMPSKWSNTYWMARAFNAVMRIRNTVWSPPFVMYYLTFLLPSIAIKLRSVGFDVEEMPLDAQSNSPYRLVVATRP